MKKEEVFNIIVNNICDVIPALKKHTFQPNDILKDLGANSLDRTEIIEMTMESLSLEIPRVEIYGAKNIQELVDIFYHHINKKAGDTQ